MMDYTLIRSKRRTLSLQISPNGELIARAPTRMSEDIIENFIRQKESWIKKHQQRMKQKVSLYPPKIYSPEIIESMKKELRDYLIILVPDIWTKYDLPRFTSLKVTKSEHRWGSCSAKNGLCFSYRLAEYLDTNPKFIEAIIVHELAHLREKNHQKPFWNLVYQMMPDYDNIINEKI